MVNSELKRCFIVAPFHVDTSLLREELAARGVTVWDAASLLVRPAVHHSVSAAIADVDFVCGVIPEGKIASNIFLELGMALGAGRPVLLIVAPGAEIPLTLRGQPYVQAAIQGAPDREGLRFQLDVFLKHVGKNGNGASSDRGSPRLTTNSAKIRSILEEIDAWERQGKTPTERELVGLLARSFEAVGYVASAAAEASTPTPDRADLAVWVDELETVALNPILIVVVDEAAAPREVEALEARLHDAGLLLGLVVRWTASLVGVHGDSSSLPVVVELTVRELVEMLRDGSFAKNLWERRNLAVHAVA